MRITITVVVGLLAAGARAGDLAERAARSYRIDTTGSTTELAIGEGGVVAIAIRTEAGVHVQSQAPLRVKLSASPGLELARDRLSWSDAVAPPQEPPRFEVEFTATSPGPQAVRARLEFFVCSSEWCAKQAREILVPITVEDARASEAAPYLRPRQRDARRRRPGVSRTRLRSA